MSADGPQQPKRPWLVRTRAKSWRTGEWSAWRAYSTFRTRGTAQARANKLLSDQWEAQVYHRDALKALHHQGVAA
jgi:hypothetical protein